MSIEALLTELAAAVRTNTEAVHLLTQSLAGRTPDKAKGPKSSGDTLSGTGSVTSAKVKDTAPVEAVQDAAAETNVSTTEAEESKEDSPVAYGTVRELVVKLAPNNRDAVKAIIEKHKLGKLPELLDDDKDFGTVNDQPKLESIYAALQELEV